MRMRSIVWAGVAALMCARATTLQQLSLDDMIRQSTGIVRARVTGSSSALRGQSIYTYYHLQVLETLKSGGDTVKSSGNRAAEMDVAVPGGTVNGMRQVAVGAPELTKGSQYVVFLWTGRSGLTQIMGLSQGLFQASQDDSGKIRLSRPAAAEVTLDSNGKMVSGKALGLEWSDLQARIQKELAK